MSSQKPTIIFVPGAWHPASAFSRIITLLTSHGYPCIPVDLPSIGSPQPLSDFQPDISAIRAAITSTLSRDPSTSIVVLVHSYGALPANEAIKGFVQTDSTAGVGGGVTHLFFCCSFVIFAGQTLISAFGGQDLPWFVINEDRTIVNPATPKETFYNDLPDSVGEDMVHKLKPQSYQCFHSPLSWTAWLEVPSTYLFGLRDEAIPITIQRQMVEAANKAGACGGKGFQTQEVDAGHSPFLSRPEETVAAIRRAAGEDV